MHIPSLLFSLVDKRTSFATFTEQTKATLSADWSSVAEKASVQTGSTDGSVTQVTAAVQHKPTIQQCLDMWTNTCRTDGDPSDSTSVPVGFISNRWWFPIALLGQHLEIIRERSQLETPPEQTSVLIPFRDRSPGEHHHTLPSPILYKFLVEGAEVVSW